MKNIVILVSFIAMAFTQLPLDGELELQAGHVEEIVQLMEVNEVDVTEWRLYTRGEHQIVQDKEEYEKNLTNFKMRFDGFEWQQIDDEHWKVQGQKAHSELPFVEQLTVLAYPSGQSYSMYLIYELHGSSWNEDTWQHIAYEFHERYEQLFPDENSIFTTVTGKTHSIEVGSLYETAQLYLNQLSSEKIEELNEETFVSLSAYNRKWMDSIQTNENQMNVQVALRQSPRMGGETTVTIGTPIITTEY
ncbi:YwmB family TATA-box binding protein [Bacillus sp. FJAT-45350]|uniref:YwmB family TATA-box binding protein n=1 Tax=Bacillus sp. FJAT-45350 TaxID=2011014 RepID=UPI000BB80E8C|nr:YwmB family TATA-box binding protein [Bacillus sp. FJAT-45350]